VRSGREAWPGDDPGPRAIGRDRRRVLRRLGGRVPPPDRLVPPGAARHATWLIGRDYLASRLSRTSKTRPDARRAQALAWRTCGGGRPVLHLRGAGALGLRGCEPGSPVPRPAQFARIRLLSRQWCKPGARRTTAPPACALHANAPSRGRCGRPRPRTLPSSSGRHQAVSTGRCAWACLVLRFAKAMAARGGYLPTETAHPMSISCLRFPPWLS